MKKEKDFNINPLYLSAQNFLFISFSFLITADSKQSLFSVKIMPRASPVFSLPQANGTFFCLRHCIAPFPSTPVPAAHVKSYAQRETFSNLLSQIEKL